jgi:quercetin dioxygenase-like cupin family protein
MLNHRQTAYAGHLAVINHMGGVINHCAILGLASAVAMHGLAIPVTRGGELPQGALSVTPSQLSWVPGRVPGIENAALLGSSKAQGPYTERVRFPPNFVIQPHNHPDQRTYTILSGTWYIGYGDTFDETKLQALPQGSFYVEPTGVNHFVATKDEPVVLQLSGMGPTATRLLDQAKPRK